VLFLRIFQRRWLLATLLVFLGTGVLVRLGVWQLDRLEQRRAFNARVAAQVDASPLELDANALSLDLYDMEYRQVVVTGEYDHSQEVVWRNQVWGGEYGVHVLTPLLISGTGSAVLVDRGFLPASGAVPEARSEYNVPGTITVEGLLLRGQDEPRFAGVPDPTLSPGQTRLDGWNFINLERIARQVDAPLLPVYIEQAPDGTNVDLPYRSQTTPDLTEGPHFGYALQWFAFALILFVGYLFFVRQHSSPEAQLVGEGNAA
jgi:surfeit locus 1 family protein